MRGYNFIGKKKIKNIMDAEGLLIDQISIRAVDTLNEWIAQRITEIIRVAAKRAALVGRIRIVPSDIEEGIIATDTEHLKANDYVKRIKEARMRYLKLQKEYNTLKRQNYYTKDVIEKLKRRLEKYEVVDEFDTLI